MKTTVWDRVLPARRYAIFNDVLRGNYERTRPDEQAAAFTALAGPREGWEIA